MRLTLWWADICYQSSSSGRDLSHQPYQLAPGCVFESRRRLVRELIVRSPTIRAETALGLAMPSGITLNNIQLVGMPCELQVRCL